MFNMERSGERHNFEKETGEPSDEAEIKYVPRLKRFGERAERILRPEFFAAADEVIALAASGFDRLQTTEQLTDKESFGDIDIIALRSEAPDRDLFSGLLGERLEDYYRNGTIYDLLTRLSSGKIVQTDFIWAKDREDFDRKFMYYSKGPMSAMVGILAKQLDFKYGTEGFFKRFHDRKGNWHDIPVSGDLEDGLRILGLDPAKYRDVHRIEEIADFIASSPLFGAQVIQPENLPHRHRRDIQRWPTQDHLYKQLLASDKKRTIADNDALFKEKFPDRYAAYLEAVERINVDVRLRGVMNGDLIMRTFGLSPGPLVGKVLKYIAVHYPDGKELDAAAIEEIRKEVLNI